MVKRYQANKNLNKILLLGVNISIKDVEDYFHFFNKNNLLKVDKIEVDPNTDDSLLNSEYLLNQIKTKDFTEIFLSISTIRSKTIESIIYYAEENLKRVHLVIDDKVLNDRHLEFTRYGQLPVINLLVSPLDDFTNQLVKRIFDVFFSLFVIVFILSWLFPLTAIIIKLTSKGPVLFKQMRTGINNQPFVCYKFRSMVDNPDADRMQATQNDPRVTGFGKFLRKSSLDEFPQFFNVFAGKMSVVGPRPHMLKHTVKYNKAIGKFMQRHAIKPGITGLAQAKGYRGEIKNISLLQNRVRLDRFYIENWSFKLDIKIIFMTIRDVFSSHL